MAIIEFHEDANSVDAKRIAARFDSLATEAGMRPPIRCERGSMETRGGAG